MKVPGYDNPICDCGGGIQTAKHVILFCPLYDRDELLEELGTQDYRVITSTPKGLKAVTKWILNKGLLEQFKLYRGG